ncbi:unnamed protein product [Symbiodinium necroappetens]|uniref:Uncharacterized protein n=1 Tax=Symbiodinium necroappetens TaxID=1628268 RepID=A0A813B2W3_9DINO|nr:unnamed protein product [Symbiodinium microadriaticum]CAE7890033.1 unnamed protein product [Symbiodinium necroappetens]CAE7945423.1 unnamed protein product [Symbiodinium sp. KB8]
MAGTGLPVFPVPGLPGLVPAAGSIPALVTVPPGHTFGDSAFAPNPMGVPVLAGTPTVAAASALQYPYIQNTLPGPSDAHSFQVPQPPPQDDEKDVKQSIKELQARFKLDDRIVRDLAGQMKKRRDTSREDMQALWEILGGARNPAGLLRVKIREMEDGKFRGTLTPDKDVEELAKKFNLDAQAAAKLAEVLSRRDDRKKDLRQIQKHLQLSNRPSSLVMLMLKDMRNGLPIRDPEYPPAVGSLAHKRGMKGQRSRSRTKRRRASSSSSPPLRSPVRSCGAGPDPKKVATARGPRPQTLLERFG